jgi:hypothetical protein
VDSSIAIARAINNLKCSDEVKDVLRKMYAEELGASAQVAKGRYTTAIENAFEGLLQNKDSAEETK